MTREAADWISALKLEKHVEGGWFREIYRSPGIIQDGILLPDFQGARNYSTSIYFLLQGDEFSSFHRVRQDEIWHYYEGTASVKIVILSHEGFQTIRLGRKFNENEVFQAVIPGNSWFAAFLTDSMGYALVGCTVSPGFDFRDFELGDREVLSKEFPHSVEIIDRLTRL